MQMETLIRWYDALVNDTLVILGVWLMAIICWPSNWPGSPSLAAISGPAIVILRVFFFIIGECKIRAYSKDKVQDESDTYYSYENMKARRMSIPDFPEPEQNVRVIKSRSRKLSDL